ncbi:MAG: hypothetical protein V2B14_04070 [bacterium]
MAKTYNLRLIKTRESYSTKRISQELGVHARTVQEWYKEGLNPIENTRPYLVMGYELKQFLEKKIQRRKTKLQPDEFYCTKCREAVRPTDNDVWVEISERTIGNQGFKAMTVKGVCENCNSRINRFSHTEKFDEVKQIFDVIEIMEQEK